MATITDLRHQARPAPVAEGSRAVKQKEACAATGPANRAAGPLEGLAVPTGPRL